jgi:hypothetical protein
MSTLVAKHGDSLALEFSGKEGKVIALNETQAKRVGK